MNFQAGFLLSDEGAHLKHVGLEDRAVLAVEVESVVLKERASLAFRHHPHCAIEGSALPVAFCAEAVAFSHEALRSETGNLVEAYKFRVVDVVSAEVVEVGCEALGALCSEDCAESELGVSRVPDLLVFLCGGVL